MRFGVRPSVEGGLPLFLSVMHDQQFNIKGILVRVDTIMTPKLFKTHRSNDSEKSQFDTDEARGSRNRRINVLTICI